MLNMQSILYYCIELYLSWFFGIILLLVQIGIILLLV